MSLEFFIEFMNSKTTMAAKKKAKKTKKAKKGGKKR
jgi:hypothetical protein